jgi:hypothetical protein
MNLYEAIRELSASIRSTIDKSQLNPSNNQNNVDDVQKIQ